MIERHRRVLQHTPQSIDKFHVNSWSIFQHFLSLINWNYERKYSIPGFHPLEDFQIKIKLYLKLAVLSRDVSIDLIWPLCIVTFSWCSLVKNFIPTKKENVSARNFIFKIRLARKERFFDVKISRNFFIEVTMLSKGSFLDWRRRNFLLL